MVFIRKCKKPATVVVRYEGKHVTVMSGNDIGEYTVPILFIV